MLQCWHIPGGINCGYKVGNWHLAIAVWNTGGNMNTSGASTQSVVGQCMWPSRVSVENVIDAQCRQAQKNTPQLQAHVRTVWFLFVLSRCMHTLLAWELFEYLVVVCAVFHIRLAERAVGFRFVACMCGMWHVWHVACVLLV
jgi:hypothetical protein